VGDVATTSIAVVTSEVGLARDADLPLILAALRAEGLAAEAVRWDDGDADWGRFDLAVIRSTWDYAGRLDDFLTWADTAAAVTRLWNPLPVVRWNADKRYLLDLAEAGVPVVPTRVIAPGARVGEADFDPAEELVVKPAVSAGARDTARYRPGSHGDAARHAQMLLDQGRAVLVQPYLPLVAEGERALVFVAGTFSHAMRKGPLLTEPGVIDNARDAHPGLVPYQPTDGELDTALKALAAVPWPETPLFARVDLALDGTREPVVMELELLEPNLFLKANPQGLERLVAAIAAESRRGSAA
jgi:glutathione synthase/RimK-type ligase-like ATP-grasp enzyme